MEDMTSYRPHWTEPMRISYRDYEVASIGNNHHGALRALGSLKAAEFAQLKQYGHYTTSAESLLYLIQISRVHMQLLAQSPERRATALPGFNPATDSQVSRETAERVIAHIRKNLTAGHGDPSEGSHTAPIVVVDAKGNVASLVPTIVMADWGHTGLFVNGVSIPDAAKFLQPSMASVGPGARLPDPTTPMLVLRDGKPILAFGSLGGNGLPTLVLQTLVSILEFDMDVQTAANQPYTLGGYLSRENGVQGAAALEREVILRRTFSPTLLDDLRSLGQEIEVLSESSQEAAWIGIQIDPKTRSLKAGATPGLPALAEAF
jgi:gamma-glutamyltranspeptidase/glutathione hydrolase